MGRSTSRKLVLESFELALRDIHEAEPALLHALSTSVGWPHRPDDWAMLRELGHGVVAMDAIGRVIASGMWFRHAPEMATLGMTITTPRLQQLGGATRLMERVIALADAPVLTLSATRASHHMFRSLGFGGDAPIHQCQGEAVRPPAAPPPRGLALRAVAPRDRPALIALDGAAIGVARPALLTRLLHEATGVALIGDGGVEGFALARRFGRGHVIGPVVAAGDAEAMALVAPLITDLAGGFVRLDTRFPQREFGRFLTASGLRLHDIVTAMRRGPGDWPRGEVRGYALVSQALG